MRTRINLLPIIIGFIVIVAIVARGCQQGPFGRQQLVTISPRQEAALGAQAFREVLQEAQQNGQLVRGGAANTVEQIGRHLAAAANDPTFLKITGLKPVEYDWQFRVVDDRQVNAFCLPGGKVVVYTGILPVCENTNGLATVMGHEIAHALAHHGAERMAQQQLVQIGQVAAASSLGGDSPEQQRMVMAALGLGVQYGVLLPYSRSHESEADHVGLLLMAVAGYDPEAAVQFWSRMERVGGRRPPEFLSTHPDAGRRQQNLRHWLNEAIPLYDRSNRQPVRSLTR